MSMSRYPDDRRPPARQQARPAPAKKKSAPAARPAQSRSQQSRSAQSRPQQSRPPVKKTASRPASQQPRRPQNGKKPQHKGQKAPQRSYGSLVLFLWIALAFPELVLHLSTAKSGDLLFNSGLVLGPVFAALPAFVIFALGTSLSRSANYALTLIYTALSYLLCASQLVYYRIFGTF